MAHGLGREARQRLAETLAPLRDSPLLLRLDRVSFPRALAGGLVAGAGLGLAVALRGGTGFVVLGAVVLVAGGLALSAEPRVEWRSVELDEETLAGEKPTPRSSFLRMIPIPAGDFLMGASEDDGEADSDEKPQHRVALPAFLMGETVVTRGQYAAVMGKEAPGQGGDEHPVTKVSWFDAVRFCNRLSEEEGHRRSYTLLWKFVECHWKADGYRLPTEAEWEYAARAGTTSRWSFGDDEKDLGEHVWFAGNSDSVQPVAQRKPNPWGLYDVHGNVWEWCWDGYKRYKKRRVVDPNGPPFSSLRVLRGGAFWRVRRRLRLTGRLRLLPGDRDGYIGFRCVRRPRPASLDLSTH